MLSELCSEYEKLLDEKERLAADVKKNNAALKNIQAEIAEQMVAEDCTGVRCGGVSYFLTTKERLDFISKAKTEAQGLDRMEVLRNNGLDYLIKETVNNGSVKNALEERYGDYGEWPDDLKKICRIYEEVSIGHRKG